MASDMDFLIRKAQARWRKITACRYRGDAAEYLGESTRPSSVAISLTFELSYENWFNQLECESQEGGLFIIPDGCLLTIANS